MTDDSVQLRIPKQLRSQSALSAKQDKSGVGLRRFKPVNVHNEYERI